MKRLVRFQRRSYELVVTHHAKLRMADREVSFNVLLDLLDKGSVKEGKRVGHFWIYSSLEEREDNLLSLSIRVEEKRVVVVTVMTNWSLK